MDSVPDDLRRLSEKQGAKEEVEGSVLDSTIAALEAFRDSLGDDGTYLRACGAADLAMRAAAGGQSGEILTRAAPAAPASQTTRPSTRARWRRSRTSLPGPSRATP